MMLTFSYIAGLFDADGCCCIAYMKKKPPKKNRYQSYFTIANADKSVLDEIKETFGVGYVNTHHVTVKGKKYRNSYTYQVGKPEQLVNVINKILPYSRIKHDRLLLLLSYCNHVLRIWDTPKGKQHRWSDEELDFVRSHYFESLKKLNSGKGVRR